MFLLFLRLVGAAQSLEDSTKTLQPSPEATNDLVEFHLKNSLNATELGSLQHTVPLEQIEWIDATNPWSSSIQYGRQTHDIGSNLPRRYVSTTKCPNVQRRLMLGSQLHAVIHMVHDAQRNLTLAHPVWRTLIAAPLRGEPGVLQRTKHFLNILYETINDPSHTITLTCNAATLQCVQKQKGPTGREQVPAGFYSTLDSTVNLCNGFFALPRLEQVECTEGAPMSGYDSAGASLSV